MKRTRIVVVGVFACALLASACTKKNPAYCESNADCVVGDCRVDINTCESNVPDANQACMDHSDCDGICGQASQCVACAGSSDCLLRGDAREVCDDQNGRCVECVTGDDCDDAAPACVANGCSVCTSNEQCEQRTASAEIGLCNGAAGTCLVTADVLVVDVNDGNCGNGGMPYCQITTAAQDISGGNTGGISDVLVRPGTYEPFIVNASMRIVGVDQQVIVNAGGAATAVEITGNGVVAELRRMRVTNATNTPDSAGVLCRNGATCTLSQLLANQNSIGVRANNARLFLTRSTVELNVAGGGIDVLVADFVITSNAILNNGSSFNMRFGGVSLGADAGGARVFAHNTLFNNNGPTGVSGAVGCSEGTTLSSNVFWQNGGTSEVGSLCTVEYSVINDPVIGAMNNNIMNDPLLADTSSPGFDMHITAGSPCLDAGDPGGTLVYDIDGELRSDGLPDIGADEI